MAWLDGDELSRACGWRLSAAPRCAASSTRWRRALPSVRSLQRPPALSSPPSPAGSQTTQKKATVQLSELSQGEAVAVNYCGLGRWDPAVVYRVHRFDVFGERRRLYDVL